MIDQKIADSLLEKATIAAEDEAKLKKKKDGEDAAEVGGKGGSAMEVSGSARVHMEDEDDDETKVHPEAAFETLKDGSTALIIKPGFR